MNKLLAILLLSVTMISCQPEGRIFSENKELSANLEWLKDDAVTFKVPVEDIGSTYDMSLTFRYTEGYQYDVAKVKVTQISPSGKEIENEYSMKVRDENGDYIGEAALDIWDSEHLVEEKMKFDESGTHSFKVEHIMPRDPLHFAMEIGLILDKSE
ncbi:MAG: gliding motility lipoprotein GldH [Crocinitomicaceae bacterium]|nr:gliding motility lipoprotein GldH [Crocinitomicaceae bacterium]